MQTIHGLVLKVSFGPEFTLWLAKSQEIKVTEFTEIHTSGSFGHHFEQSYMLAIY